MITSKLPAWFCIHSFIWASVILYDEHGSPTIVPSSSYTFLLSLSERISYTLANNWNFWVAISLFASEDLSGCILKQWWRYALITVRENWAQLILKDNIKRVSTVHIIELAATSVSKSTYLHSSSHFLTNAEFRKDWFLQTLQRIAQENYHSFSKKKIRKTVSHANIKCDTQLDCYRDFKLNLTLIATYVI